MSAHTHRYRSGKPRRTGGQAMVEAVIVTLVLLVVLFGIVLIGKRVDMAHASILASRYAAFERSVWTPGGKSDTQIEIEIRNRLYASPDRPLSAADDAAVAAPLNPLWTRRDGSAALAAYARGETTLTHGDGDTTPGVVFSRVTQRLTNVYDYVVGILNKVGGVKQARFTINVYGMYRGAAQPVILAAEASATAGSRLADIVRFPEIGDIRMQRQSVVVVTDTWGASEDGKPGTCGGSSPTSTVCQVDALTPTYALSGWVNKVIDVVGYVVPEFKGGAFRFGYVDPSTTPDYKGDSK
ncbi:MAG TPA: hypothetical protein VNT02_04070 [Burkholderiales bacterium]|nr:hypothetical protein [Burkholderiales bacterium]